MNYIKAICNSDVKSGLTTIIYRLIYSKHERDIWQLSTETARGTGEARSTVLAKESSCGAGHPTLLYLQNRAQRGAPAFRRNHHSARLGPRRRPRLAAGHGRESIPRVAGNHPQAPSTFRRPLAKFTRRTRPRGFTGRAGSAGWKMVKLRRQS